MLRPRRRRAVVLASRIGSWVAGIAAAMCAAMMAFGGAVAHADEYDFVSEFESVGVHYLSIADLVGLGHLACRQLSDGTDVTQVLVNMRDAEAQLPPPRLDGGPGYSTSTLRAVSIVTRATRYLCPEQRYRMDEYISR